MTARISALLATTAVIASGFAAIAPVLVPVAAEGATQPYSLTSSCQPNAGDAQDPGTDGTDGTDGTGGDTDGIDAEATHAPAEGGAGTSTPSTSGTSGASETPETPETTVQAVPQPSGTETGAPATGDEQAAEAPEDGAPCQAPAARQPELRLAPMCALTTGAQRWRVRNTGEDAVKAEWMLPGSASHGVIVAQPGDTLFEAPAGTLVLTWDGGSAVKASRAEPCRSGKSLRKALQLISVCQVDEAVNRWKVRNPNRSTVEATWAVYDGKVQSSVTARPGDTVFTAPPGTLVLSWPNGLTVETPGDVPCTDGTTPVGDGADGRGEGESAATGQDDTAPSPVGTQTQTLTPIADKAGRPVTGFPAGLLLVPLAAALVTGGAVLLTARLLRRARR